MEKKWVNRQEERKRNKTEEEKKDDSNPVFNSQVSKISSN